MKIKKIIISDTLAGVLMGMLEDLQHYVGCEVVHTSGHRILVIGAPPQYVVPSFVKEFFNVTLSLDLTGGGLTVSISPLDHGGGMYLKDTKDAFDKALEKLGVTDEK